jgi:hypothetical protein
MVHECRAAARGDRVVMLKRFDWRHAVRFANSLAHHLPAEVLEKSRPTEDRFRLELY